MRVAIVNDIVLAAEVLKRLVLSVPGYEVAWVAYDGYEAVKHCLADKPDLILMDLVMPGISGAEATRQIMSRTPCAILVVTASVSGNISLVFDAMGHGALDVTVLPLVGNHVDSEGAKKLLEKLKMMQRLIGKDERPTVATPIAPPAPVPGVPPIIAIGASTGGPLAISTVLSMLPQDFPGAIAVVQHVDGPFVESLVSWLAQHSTLPVQVAQEGAIPSAGTVLVAGTTEHMILTKNLQIHYTQHPRASVYRPSIDVFFDSVARHWPHPGVGVLLTGMGKDGADGLKGLREVGWQTIAQDRESCVVYGMPKAAIEIGAATHILPLEAIAPEIVKWVNADFSHAGRSQ